MGTASMRKEISIRSFIHLIQKNGEIDRRYVESNNRYSGKSSKELERQMAPQRNDVEGFPYFEVLPKTSRRSGTSLNSEIVAYRSYPDPK
jgi:hypothetical protein